MNNMIHVVNQHAKLLDTVSTELKQRPVKAEVGEMFSLLSHTYPYEKVLSRMGYQEATQPPRTIYITEQLNRRQVASNLVLVE